MSVETTSFVVPTAIGFALALIPWRWSLALVALFVLAGILSLIGAGTSGEIPAPFFWLFFMIMALPLVLLGLGLGLLVRRLIWSPKAPDPAQGDDR